MSITTNVLLNWYSSMKKKMRKIRMIFYIENWLWKSNFGTFWQLALIQNSKFNNFLWVCWFLGKNHSNFVPPAWKLHNPYCHNVGQPNILVPLPGIFHTKYWTFTIGFVKAGNFFVDSLQTICRINPESQNITPA